MSPKPPVLKPREVVAEFSKYLHDELDLMREAANCSQLRRNFRNSPLLRTPVDETSGVRGPIFSKCGMPCVSSVRRNMPNSQRGRSMQSQARRGVGRSGEL